MGTSTVRSGLSPKAETATLSPIAGMRSSTGADRAATGAAADVDTETEPLVKGGAATREADGPTRALSLPRTPTTTRPAAMTSRTAVASHHPRRPDLGKFRWH